MKIALFLLLLVALGVAALLWRASRNEAQARRSWPPGGRMVAVNGRMLHLQITGEGPPIVLIHGASGNLRDMTFRLAPALAEHFTVIAVDRPGFGHSEPLPRCANGLREQVVVLRDALRKLGYDRVFLLGQSYGGAVALKWALEHPDSVLGTLLVSAPSNVWSGGLDPLYRVNANPVTGPLLRLWVAAFPPERLVRATIRSVFAPEPVPAGYPEHLGIGLTLRRTTQRVNAAQVAGLKGEIRAMVPHYREIEIPVEAVHGTRDQIVPAEIHTEKLAHQIRGINLTFLDGVGHMPHNTHTDKVLAAALRLAARRPQPETGPGDG